MANSVAGGGLHDKHLSKADVSVNIYANLKAQKIDKVGELACTISDEFIDKKPYGKIVLIVRNFIDSLGGFKNSLNRDSSNEKKISISKAKEARTFL